MEGLSGLAVDFVVALLAAIVAVWAWRQKTRWQSVENDEDEDKAPAPNLPAQFDWLSPVQQACWQRQIKRFLREKRFIGCAGLRLTDAHCHQIAAMACLLRVQADAERQPLFPTVREVLIYPDAFLVPPAREAVSDDGLELVDDHPEERIGEHAAGQVVLSWVDVEAACMGDAVNVVVHEFAHALDSENPETEGAPPMADYTEWSAAMGAEFARLKRHRRPPVLDPYGAQSPAEFWCVVVEAFFQQPEALARHHAELFQLLTRYFEITPPTG